METERTRRVPRRSVPRTRTASRAPRSTTRKTPGFGQRALRRVQKRLCAARTLNEVTAAPDGAVVAAGAGAGAAPPPPDGAGEELAAGDWVGVGLGVEVGDGTVPVWFTYTVPLML